MVGGVLSVRMTVTMEGTLTNIAVSPPGPTATCVQHVFESARVPPPTGGPATLDGVVLIPESQDC